MQRVKRVAVIALVVVTIALVARNVSLDSVVATLKSRMPEPFFLQIMLYASCFAVGALLLLPGTVFMLGAGVLFGPVWGAFAASAGALVATAAAIAIARTVAADWLRKKLTARRRLSALHAAIDSGGWKMVLLLRLSPFISFSISNYLIGLTKVPYWKCVIAAWIGVLPWISLFAWSGAVGREGIQLFQSPADQSPATLALLCIGIAATVGGIVYATKLTRQKLAEFSALENEQT